MMSRHLVPAPQQPRAVLPEEEYQRNLSEVIQRQYYPDLVDLQAQASVQRKLEAGDVVGAESVRRAAGLLKFHDALVQQAELEEEEGGGGAESDGGGYGANLRSKPRPLHLETLTGFHARVTSEDNADFETAQTEEMRQNQIERAKMLLLTSADHGAQKKAAPNPALPLLPGAETPLFLASDAFDAPPSAARPKAKEAPVENGFFFVPSIVEPSRTHNEEDSNQKRLMPPPSSKSNQLLATTVSASSAAAPTIPNSLVEYIPKRHIEKMIEPANTRFPSQSQLTNLIGTAHYHLQRHLEGDNDDESTRYSFRDGSAAAAASDSDTDIDRDSVDGSSVTSERLHELRRQAQKRKERGWQTLMPLSPSTTGAATHRQHDVNQSLAMDPSSSSSTTSLSFQLPPTLPREVVAERAHELSQRRSRRAGQAFVSSSSSSSASRSSSRLPSSSASASGSQQSVRSALSRSGTRGVIGRPNSSALPLSRSALGTALRSAYGGSIGPASVGGGGSVSAQSRRSTTSSTSSVSSRRDRSLSRSTGLPRVTK